MEEKGGLVGMKQLKLKLGEGHLAEMATQILGRVGRLLVQGTPNQVLVLMEY
jgi:hypothetical protein